MENYIIVINNKTIKSFINPTFEDLLKVKSSSNLIFEGFLTLGDYNALNTSIVAQIYRKHDKLIVIGEIETLQLIKQNSQLTDLNREIGNLQREALKKEHILKHTLKELEKSNSELKKEQMNRDKLFSVIAHDLRSPFNGFWVSHNY